MIAEIRKKIRDNNRKNVAYHNVSGMKKARNSIYKANGYLTYRTVFETFGRGVIRNGFFTQVQAYGESVYLKYF